MADITMPTYNLEPNLKESPGGLRDLQNILWVSRAAGLGKSWSGTAERRIHHAAGKHALRSAIKPSCKTCVSGLHYLAGRREDRLLFDYQTSLAEELGIIGKPPRRAGEMLMQRTIVPPGR